MVNATPRPPDPSPPTDSDALRCWSQELYNRTYLANCEWRYTRIRGSDLVRGIVRGLVLGPLD